MIFHAPLKRLAKIDSAFVIGLFWLLGTSLGLVIPQSTSFSFGGSVFVIKDIFLSWWYLALEILLATSLVSCSFLDQLFVLRCQNNTTKKLKRVRVTAATHKSFQDSVRLGKLAKKFPKILGARHTILQRGLLRGWAPLGVHVLVVTLVTYGALDMLYTCKGASSLSVSEGLFLSSSGSQQSSSAHPRPLVYCRLNDSWSFTDPYQPFVDMSVLGMDGTEYKRFTITVSSKGAASLPSFWPSQSLNLESTMSLSSLTPRRIRMTGQTLDVKWEQPALSVGRADNPSWLSTGLEGEVLTGWEGGVLVLSDQPRRWNQQDVYEELPLKRMGMGLIDVLAEANMAWSSNELWVEIFAVPLFSLLLLLAGFSKDIFFEF